LADKLDTLVGFFFVGEKPTGSKDPFALRRAAIGVLSLMTLNGLRCALQSLLCAAMNEHILRLRDAAFQDVDRDEVKKVLQAVGKPKATVGVKVEGKFDPDAVFDDLPSFFVDRLKVQQREAGVRHDLIDAVFALGGEDDLVRLLARVKALQAFVGTDEGENLLAGYKRAANILKADPDAVRVELSRDTAQPNAGLSTSLEANGVESALLEALNTAEPKAATAIEAEDFEGAMAALASLRAPIDAFFDGVMVNDPDPAKRAFRLGLLTRFRDAVHQVADFSKIEG
jgi:glycyl-tRNA synthetase beta chain